MIYHCARMKYGCFKTNFIQRFNAQNLAYFWYVVYGNMSLCICITYSVVKHMFCTSTMYRSVYPYF